MELSVKETGAGHDGTGYGIERSMHTAKSRSAWIDNAQATPFLRYVTRTAAFAIVLAFSGAMGVQKASAGTYVMRNCNVPGYGSSSMQPWQSMGQPDDAVSVADACATGEGVKFVPDGSRSWGGNQGASIGLLRPTGVRSDIRFVKFVLWYAARLSGSGQPINFFTFHVDSAFAIHPGLYNPPPGSENVVAEQQVGPDTTDFRVGVECGTLGGPTTTNPPCVPANSVPLLVRGMEVTLREEVPPVILPPSGTLLNAGAQSGIRTLTYSASDPESGLIKVDALLGDTVVGSHDLSPRCPGSDFTVCPASETGAFQVDTRAVANGSHPLTIRVKDAAGNQRIVHRESAVEVANPPGIGQSPTTASRVPTYTLSARFKGKSSRTLTVPYGGRVSVSGYLTAGSTPVAAGTLVAILEKRDRRGAREVPRARVKTLADGSFSAVLATTRPSRRIRLAYPTAGSNQIVSSTLRLRVRAASRVSASLRGRLLRFTGRVVSGPIPKRGKQVLMEGRSPGSAWTKFKRLRTDRKGRFSGAYRLRVRRPGVALRVRAVVPSEGGYGYLSSRSRAVTLRVR